VRAREGWGRFKVCALLHVNRQYSRTTLNVQKKSCGGGGRSKSATPGQRTPHRNPRAENNPPLKVFSKWQANPDEVEAHEQTAEVHALALEGR